MIWLHVKQLYYTTNLRSSSVHVYDVILRPMDKGSDWQTIFMLAILKPFSV